MPRIQRVAILASLSLIPATAFAAVSGADGGLCASICRTLGLGCC